MKLLGMILAAALPCMAVAQSGDTKAKEQALQAAQERLRKAGAEVVKLSQELGQAGAPVGGQYGTRAFTYRYNFSDDRARLGVVLGSIDGFATITAVTPGSPAEAAGLVSNDRVLSVNGAKIAKSDDAGALARKAIGELKDGQKLALGVERGGKPRSVEVTARKLEPQAFTFSSDGLRPLEKLAELRGMDGIAPELERNIELIVENAQSMASESGRMAQVQMIRRLSDLELASINAGLGKYFGAEKGVLVLDQNNSYPGIQTGDVLIEIDGKPIEQARDAWRAMNSFEEGEKFEVVLLRERARRSVAVTAPKQDLMKWMLPAPPAPPAPPPPPKAPAPPNAPPPPAPPAPPSVVI